MMTRRGVAQQRRVREAAIEPDAHAHAGKRFAQQHDQALQQITRAGRRRGVAGAQHRGAEILVRLVLKRQEREQGQVAPRVVMAVEERQLLRAVCRIVREVDRDAARPATQAAAVALDHGRRQFAAHRIQRAWARAILKARHRRLRRQRPAVHRMPIEQ